MSDTEDASLAYSTPGLPSGASIGSSTGVFSWKPTSKQRVWLRWMVYTWVVVWMYS
ncbi:putative Ig domain-containing protein [Methanococcoides methylutens]|uniref:putative Ig domain-containing protein n=1 Tax=Methanococcoides methylutens TaxID=2226 RepID=UPI004044E34C